MAYFLSIVCAKNCQNWLIIVEVIVSSVLVILSDTVYDVLFHTVCSCHKMYSLEWLNLEFIELCISCLHCPALFSNLSDSVFNCL